VLHLPKWLFCERSQTLSSCKLSDAHLSELIPLEVDFNELLSDAFWDSLPVLI